MEWQSAVIGGVTGGTIGAIVGGLVSLWVQRREHSARASEQAKAEAHALRMAREERRQSRRVIVYEEVVGFGYRLNDYVQRTEPILSPAADPPPPLPDEDLRRLNTFTALHASSAVQAATRTMSDVVRKFQGAVFVLDAERSAMARPTEILKLWERVEAERTTFREALERLRTLASGLDHGAHHRATLRLATQYVESLGATDDRPINQRGGRQPP